MNKKLLAYSEKNLVIPFECDITCHKNLADVLAKIQKRWGEPSILINNAALDSPPDSRLEDNGAFESYSEKKWDEIIDVNLKGTFLACQVFGSNMSLKNIKGSIINISSIYGNVSPNQTIYEYPKTKGKQFYKPVAYCVSKSAVLNLTRYLATYWGGGRDKSKHLNTCWSI